MPPAGGSTTSKVPEPKGKMITDATLCPQDIAYPTDLNLLNEAREKSEELIDVLFGLSQLPQKPRTYRNQTSQQYLRTAKKKTKTNLEIRKALRKQLAYLRRNLKIIDQLLDEHERTPLDKYHSISIRPKNILRPAIRNVSNEGTQCRTPNSEHPSTSCSTHSSWKNISQS